MLHNKISFYKLTDDEWYGTDRLDNGFTKQRVVKVSYMMLRDGQFRICAWGNDDYGLKFDTSDWIQAQKVFMTVISMYKVNKQSLIDMGFITA